MDLKEIIRKKVVDVCQEEEIYGVSLEAQEKMVEHVINQLVSMAMSTINTDTFKDISYEYNDDEEDEWWRVEWWRVKGKG